MYITRIKLKEKGISGAEIDYRNIEERSGRHSQVPITKSPPHPIHQDLENLFKDLRFYILDLYGMITEKMSKEDKDSVIYDTEVEELTAEGEYIILKGKLKVGDKFLPLKSYKVEEADDYRNFEGLKAVVENIISETKEYLNGTKKVTNIELIQKWSKLKNKTQVNEDSIKTFTPEEIAKMANDIFNKNKVELPSTPEMEDEVIIESQTIELNQWPEKPEKHEKKTKKIKKEKVKVLETMPNGDMYVKDQEEEEF